jgi:DNA polymerase-3 subunit gamma/tau
MEDYIVSARKYRPSTFKSVVGQKALTETLKSAITSNKLAHAYLFCGPRGVGKTSCARIFAKTINCRTLTPEGEACNQCESCKSFNEQRSFNIHELDAASNNSVDDIRILIEQVRISPQIGKYKVYIIDEVHMLSSQAFNAFLKTLEEPPHHAIFILATTEKQKIIPTILSRCQIYDFSRITIEDIVEQLEYIASCENVKTELEALNIIAQKADGGMRDALSIFDQVVSFTGGNITYQAVIDNLNILDYEYYFQITEAILKGNIRQSLLILNDILSKGFDGQNFITGLSSHFRNLLVCKDESTIVLFELGSSIREHYKETAKRCPDKILFKAIELGNECDLNYKNSRNKRLLLELTLIQICQYTTETPEEDGKKKNIIKPITSSSQNKNETPIEIPQKPVAVHSSTTGISNQSSGGNSTGAVNNNKFQHLRTTSLKELIEDKKEDKKEIFSDRTVLKNDFSQNDLIKYWNEYAEQLTIEKVHLKNTLKNCQPALKDNYAVEVSVYNPSQKDEIQSNNVDITNFLSKKTKNTQITINTILADKTEQDEMIYTSKEKFNYLNKKNPHVESLMKKFNLSIQ